MSVQDGERLGVLQQVALFRSFDPAQLRQVADRLKQQQYRKGDIIFQQGDPGVCLYIIARGRVRVYLSSADGREVTIRIYETGSHFGEFAVFDGAPRSASAAALSNVTTFVLYRDDFLELLQANFDLVQQVLTLLTERLRYTTTYSEQLAFLNAPARVAAQLLQLATADPQPEPQRLKVTQHDLAALACTSRESVNYALRDFAERGLIQIERGAVILLDPAALREMVG